MKDTTVTVASLRSILKDPASNLRRVRRACEVAQAQRARILLLPELMLTGHGGHPMMTARAEPVPDGPLSREVVELSRKHSLCICAGIAELSNQVVYNSMMVADQGRYLGLQRKINLSGDEYCHFGAGEEVEVFDLGDLRFGISICYDNQFPEIALIHALHRVDVIFAPHAERNGVWKRGMTRAARITIIRKQQAAWERVHRARAADHNVFALLCNAAGPSTAGLEGVVANHVGGVLGVNPHGEVFLRTKKTDFTDEIATVTLRAEARRRNHAPTRNRRMSMVMRMLGEAMERGEAAT